MKDVHIEREILLNILKENCEKHIAQYNEAIKNYRTTYIKILKKNIKLAEKNLEFVDVENINLPRPRSFEKEYVKAIKMIELSTDNSINLTSHEFTQLVLDDWSWKDDFISSSSSYSSSSSSSSSSISVTGINGGNL